MDLEPRCPALTVADDQYPLKKVLFEAAPEAVRYYACLEPPRPVLSGHTQVTLIIDGAAPQAFREGLVAMAMTRQVVGPAQLAALIPDTCLEPPRPLLSDDPNGWEMRTGISDGLAAGPFIYTIHRGALVQPAVDGKALVGEGGPTSAPLVINAREFKWDLGLVGADLAYFFADDIDWPVSDGAPEEPRVCADWSDTADDQHHGAVQPLAFGPGQDQCHVVFDTIPDEAEDVQFAVVGLLPGQCVTIERRSSAPPIPEAAHALSRALAVMKRG